MSDKALYCLFSLLYVAGVVANFIFNAFKPMISYRYPYIVEPIMFVFVIIATVVFPAVVGIVLFALRKNPKRFLSLKIALAATSLAVAFFGSILMAMLDYMSSYTEDVRNYAEVDEAVEEDMQYASKYFPSKDVIDEDNVLSYCYFYKESLCERIELKYQYDSKSEYDSELARLKNLDGVELVEEGNKLTIFREFFKDMYVVLDEENYTIDYYFESGNLDYYDLLKYNNNSSDSPKDYGKVNPDVERDWENAKEFFPESLSKLNYESISYKYRYNDIFLEPRFVVFDLKVTFPTSKEFNEALKPIRENEKFVEVDNAYVCKMTMNEERAYVVTYGLTVDYHYEYGKTD